MALCIYQWMDSNCFVLTLNHFVHTNTTFHISPCPAAAATAGSGSGVVDITSQGAKPILVSALDRPQSLHWIEVV